jgi:hypothetical protein
VNCYDLVHGVCPPAEWQQTLYWRSLGGSLTELGHETCSQGEDGGCPGAVDAVTVEDGGFYAIGSTLRVVAW